MIVKDSDTFRWLVIVIVNESYSWWYLKLSVVIFS